MLTNHWYGALVLWPFFELFYLPQYFKAAAIALMIVTILMWILDATPQVAWLHPWLPVDHFMAFGDFLRDPIAWSGPLRGLALFAGYAVFFWLLAWARFAGKDITS